jgi:hypothetical protein
MRITVVVVTLVSGLLTSDAVAQVGTTGGNAREEFTAIAIGGGGPLTSPVATNLEIVIERWTTDPERQRLLEALKQGQRAALEVLRDFPRVGYVRTPGSLSWDLQYAHQRPGEDGGRRLFLGTDRPMSFAEEVTRPRTYEYPFSFIDLRLDDDGEGSGTLSRATRVTASDDGRFIQLENYEVQPVQLNNVRPR